MTPAQKLSGGDFRSYEDPPSVELRAFPAACGAAAERQAKRDTSESDGSFFRRAGEVLGAIATMQDRPLMRANLQALGIPPNELQRIEEVQYIPDAASLATIAEDFTRKHLYLLILIANAIRGFEAGSGREVLL